MSIHFHFSPDTSTLLNRTGRHSSTIRQALLATATVGEMEKMKAFPSSPFKPWRQDIFGARSRHVVFTTIIVEESISPVNTCWKKLSLPAVDSGTPIGLKLWRRQDAAIHFPEYQGKWRCYSTRKCAGDGSQSPLPPRSNNKYKFLLLFLQVVFWSDSDFFNPCERNSHEISPLS